MRQDFFLMYLEDSLFSLQQTLSDDEKRWIEVAV